MIKGKYKQEGYRRSMRNEREEIQQATQHLFRSMLHAGIHLALLPVNTLPRKPQQHFQAARREFTSGLAALVHELADGLEEMAHDANISTKVGECSHTHQESQESEESQDT